MGPRATEANLKQVLTVPRRNRWHIVVLFGDTAPLRTPMALRFTAGVAETPLDIGGIESTEAPKRILRVLWES
ncbi:hypothetical protein ACVIVD_003440 [Bradyrhizobium liaoningense]